MKGDGFVAPAPRKPAFIIVLDILYFTYQKHAEKCGLGKRKFLDGCRLGSCLAR